MRILAIYRHYWPDTTPYARILRTILEHLSNCGHDVSIYTAQPSYNDIKQARQPKREIITGVNVRRVSLLPEKKRFTALRIVNFALFFCRVILHALFAKRYDVILGNSYPPVMMGAVLRLISRLTRTPYIYHCQDLHPESGRLAGRFRSGLLYRKLLKLDSRNCSEASRLVVLSRDMQDSIVKRGLSQEKIDVINNFVLEVPDRGHLAVPQVFRTNTADSFRILFAGNLGAYQGLERIVDAARILQDDESIQFVFLGEGEKKADLQRYGGSLVGRTVHFLPFQPLEVAFACMQRAELGLVCLKTGVYQVAFPSKSMMYLAAGCPLLAVIERKSALADLLDRCALGFVPENHTPQAIAASITGARAALATNTERQRSHIREQCQELFGRETVLASWADIVCRLDRRGGRVSLDDAPRFEDMRAA